MQMAADAACGHFIFTRRGRCCRCFGLGVTSSGSRVHHVFTAGRGHLCNASEGCNFGARCAASRRAKTECEEGRRAVKCTRRADLPLDSDAHRQKAAGPGIPPHLSLASGFGRGGGSDGPTSRLSLRLQVLRKRLSMCRAVEMRNRNGTDPKYANANTKVDGQHYGPRPHISIRHPYSLTGRSLSVNISRDPDLVTATQLE